MSAIVGNKEFIIYKTGSNYKLFRSNLSDETAGVIDIQTDFDTLWSNFKTTVGNNPASVGIRNGVYDYDTELTPPYLYFEIEGENKYGTVLRPQGNISAFNTNSLGWITMKNLRILTENDTTYTSKAIKLRCNAISRSYFNFRDLTIDHIVSSARKQFGSAIGIELTGANPAVSMISCDDIEINGFENSIFYDTVTGSPTGNIWCNENQFNKIRGIHSFNFVKTNANAAHDSFKWDFHECMHQTTMVDGTTGNMFDIDDHSTARHFVWSIDKCIMWDPINTNKKFLKTNNNCRINIINSDPIDNRYMGGAGWNSTDMIWNSGARVTRNSYHNIVSGFSKFNGTGLQFDFNISPNKINQDADKCRIFAIPVSDDCSTIPYSIRDGNRGTNAFTVRFAKPPRVGTNNVIIYWEVKEW